MISVPNSREIGREYKNRFQSLTESLGHTPTTKDREYWELSDWYRDQFDAERIRRIKEDQYEKAQERKHAQQPVRVVEKLCRICKAIIPPSGKRGRPALDCVDCRKKKGK